MAFGRSDVVALRLDYNQHRPHSSLGHLTPNEFVMQRQAEQIAEEVICSGEELTRAGPTTIKRRARLSIGVGIGKVWFSS